MKQVRRNMHGQCDGEGDRRRHHDDHAQFALDGEVREPAYQKPSGQGIYGGVAALRLRCRLVRENLLETRVTEITLHGMPGIPAWSLSDRLLGYVRFKRAQALSIRPRACCQSKAGPGSVFRPGAMSLCPT